MKGNKIIATLVVLAMVLSTLVVINVNFIEKASAKAPVTALTPGVNKFGNATTDLTYGIPYTTVYINTTKWGTATGDFKLYYPKYYMGGNGSAYSFSWEPFYVAAGVQAFVTKSDSAGSKNTPLETGGRAITFNRSGIWIFDLNTAHDGRDTTSYGGYIWVNTSTNYTISPISDFEFGTGSLQAVVDLGTQTSCMIAITNPSNATIYNKEKTGTTEVIGKGNFTLAGDYKVKAYTDCDTATHYLYKDEKFAGRTIYENYSQYYGSNYTSVFPKSTILYGNYYNYTKMGPWNPPEFNATEQTFTVTTGEPTITLTNTTIYWGFETRIDVNVTDGHGKGLTNNSAAKTNCTAIKLKRGNTYYDRTDVRINEIGNGNYSIEIPRVPSTPWANWSNLGPTPAATAGTWRVVFTNNSNNDDTDEWNGTASFVVKSSSPPVQLILVTNKTKKVDVPAYTAGAYYAGTINISFDIFGTSINDAKGRAYYGDNTSWEDYKNITVEGDILYPVNSTTLRHRGTKGNWYTHVTPTKPGGTITITIDWPGDNNGTASQTLDIVNGTYVTSAVDSFTVGVDYNLTVTVKDMDGAPVKNAKVYLMWEDKRTELNSTTGNNKAGKGLNGEYTFWINPDYAGDHYPATAPQNITIAAMWYEDFWGYTKVIMERNHNMMVNVTPTTAYAGDPVEYDIMVSLAGGGHPDKTAGGLKVGIYNETGEAVGSDIVSGSWPIKNSYDIKNREIILAGGTYHLYAYNNTHDSRGNNATLIVTPYTVTSSPSVLAWKIDQSVNMTFQLMPAGNGTLRLRNMSNSAEASVNDNTSITIENGVGTLDEVNATTLGNVTFYYTPDGGEERPADGLLRVTTATATPSPATIYLGEPTSVTITITHPATGAPLSGVLVGLDNDLNASTTILSKKPTNQTTNAQGKVTFAITADASGNVTIFIEDETDPDNEFVIIAAARKPMTVSLDPAVDEGKTFTIEAKSNGVLITDATVTFTFNGQTWPTTTGVATITAPSVSTSLTYPITATADGYTSYTGAVIMIMNIPKLIVAVSGEVKAGQTFTLTIADDMGGPVIGATVTFEGKTYTTGAGGTVTMTAPTTEGSYPVSATFPGFGSVSGTVTVLKGGGIPGFELLTLVAAIGVAFLLLRRRRN